VIGDASGNLFIADQFSVRKVNAAGQVSTLASGFNETHGLALLPGGSILVADHLNGQIKKIDPNGNVTTVLQNLSAPRGIIVQDARTFFFTQQGLPGLYKATSAIDL
jgi:DNA-binding beta-propeller fold protein YncE